MDKVLLDTDILSEVLKARNPAVSKRANQYFGVFGQYTTSSVTVRVVVEGLNLINRPDRTHRYLSTIANMEIIAFDYPAAELAGKIVAELKKTGQPIGSEDSMIAAISIVNGLSLVTGNTGHYDRITTLGYALKLINWREEQSNE